MGMKVTLAEPRVESEKQTSIVPLVVGLIIIAVAVGVGAFIVLGSWPRFGPVGPIDVVGSGNLVTKDMDFKDFTIVEVGSAFKAEITQSNSYSVSITMDDNLFDYLQASKIGERLEIGLEPGHNYRSPTLSLKITMPNLYELELSGAASGTAEGFSSSHGFILRMSGATFLKIVDMSAGDTDVELSGASHLTGGVTVDGDVRFSVSGASTAELEGAADDLAVDASGASGVELSDFPVHNADVKLSGASRATVNLDGRLDAVLSGASRLLYVGSPTMGDISTSGGSTIAKK